MLAPHAAPTPRQLLIAAQHLAIGDPPGVAATAAGLLPSQFEALHDDPNFAIVAAGCAEIEARPTEAQNARLARLARLTLERALADDRPGAAKEILRLLAPPPSQSPAEKAAVPARKRRPAVAAEPEPAESSSLPPDGSRWGMIPDEEESWVGDDGLPVLPGRPLAVVDAPGGPVRVLDADPSAIPVALLETLDGFDEAAVRDLNRAAYPRGGLQWDAKTRTLWCWGEPEGPGGAAGPH